MHIAKIKKPDHGMAGVNKQLTIYWREARIANERRCVDGCPKNSAEELAATRPLKSRLQRRQRGQKSGVSFPASRRLGPRRRILPAAPEPACKFPMERAPLRKLSWAPIQAMTVSIWRACIDNCRPAPMLSRQRNPSPPNLPNWPGASKPMVLIATRRTPKNSPASYALPMLIMKLLCGLPTPLTWCAISSIRPSNDFGPDELEAAARKVASHYKAKLGVVKGEALKRGFPMIHEVGKASPQAATPHRFFLGLGAGSQGNACRQGRVLRHGRP